LKFLVLAKRKGFEDILKGIIKVVLDSEVLDLQMDE